MLSGIIKIEWWEALLISLAYTHITIISVTLYLHRSQAHRSVEFHPVVTHIFRFWLWLTTGMNTKEWIAVHRRHHATVDTMGDPHSPSVFGLRNVLLKGAELYREASKDLSLRQRYGYGAPIDWLELKVYSAFPGGGVLAMFVINFYLFGFIGITITAIQMCWIPFFAAGVVNGLGHHTGYRNFETPDNSTNLLPIGILIGGEELHNNHHSFANSAKFSIRPWEFDLGWLYIRILGAMKLANIKSAYKLNFTEKKDGNPSDRSNAKAVVSNRLIILSNYGQLVLKKIYREECQTLSGMALVRLKEIKKILLKESTRLTDIEKRLLGSCFDSHARLAVAYDFREKLTKLYGLRTTDAYSVIPFINDWCESAEKTKITALREFSARLKSYSFLAEPR